MAEEHENTLNEELTDSASLDAESETSAPAGEPGCPAASGTLSSEQEDDSSDGTPVDADDSSDGESPEEGENTEDQGNSEEQDVEAGSSETAGEPEKPSMDWYIIKVQSNREDSICQALKRRVAMEGLDRYFGDIIVPKETVSEFKGGKKRVVQRKLYPGYILVHMEVNDDTWFLVRETPGIGDFTGSAGKPTPMLPHEVQRIVSTQEESEKESPKLRIGFQAGDRVKINEGTFDNFEGDVESIDEASGRVTVIISIFGRSTPVELEYWQVAPL